jgi:hypothetical protein
LYQIANPEPNKPNNKPSLPSAVIKEMAGFFKGLQRL